MSILSVGRPFPSAFPDCCQLCKHKTSHQSSTKREVSCFGRTKQNSQLSTLYLTRSQTNLGKESGDSNYEQYSIDLCNRLPLPAIGIKIQRNQIQEELEAFLGREACSAPAMSPLSSEQGDWVAWCSLCLACCQLTQLDPIPDRLSTREKARNTCFCGDTANPIRVSASFAQVLTVDQDAFHTADFTANSTAWYGLEVHAVSQGLSSKFL